MHTSIKFTGYISKCLSGAGFISVYSTKVRI